MPERSDSLQSAILKELTHLVEPLAELRDSEAVMVLLTELGWQVPADAAAGLVNAQGTFDAVANAVAAVQDSVYAAIAQEDPSALVSVLPKVQGVFDAAAKIKDAFAAGVDFFDNSKIKDPGTLLSRLSDYLLITYMQRRNPPVHAILSLTGFVRWIVLSPLPPYHHSQGYRVIDWAGIPRLFTQASDHLVAVYAWGKDDLADSAHPKGGFDEELFFANLLLLTRALAPSGGEYLATDNVMEMRYPIFKHGSWGDERSYQEFGLALRALAARPPQLRGLALLPYLVGTMSASIELSPRWALALQGALAATKPDGLHLELRPGEVPVLTGLPAGAGDHSLALQFGQRPNEPTSTTDIFLIGTAESAFFLRLRGVAVHVTLKASSDDWLHVAMDLGELAICLKPGVLDGFLANILPAEGLNVTAGLGMEVSNSQPPRFKGSGGLEFNLPVHESVNGVANIQSLYLSLRGSDQGIEATVTATGGVQLGPLAVGVDRVGLAAKLLFVKDRGPSVAIGFKPPDGAALALDAGVVVGGGYLFFDEQKQQYAGAVQLEIAELLNLSAFGLITTRMPDGSAGFSLLVLIATRFMPPVPLGYGFTLNGVGGLVGVNRTAAVEVLRSGLRAGTLGSVLFPVDPIRNAPQIVSDLAAVFPPAVERFLFGPMGILGWGTPTLWTLELALILELPQPVRLLLLGRLRVLLPEEHFAVVRLQLDSLGVIDFASGDVALDAVLYDSVVAQYVVTGEMALHANFGKTPGFVLAVGGFHPGFTAPAGFPALERVAISLATGDNPRLRLAAYLALTSNTVQFGALLDLYAKAGPFSAEGLLGFDAIIRIAPFGFVAELGAMVAVKFEGQVLMAAMLDVSLTGPTPWHAWGRANFKFLGTDASVSFNVQIGEEAPPPLPAPVQVRPLVLAALNQPGNWATQVPRGEHPIVVLCEQPKGTETLVHPLAALQVSQRVVPLRREITHFGNTVPEGDRSFVLEIDKSTGAGGVVLEAAQEEVKEFFAPAQFWEMSDDEKLSAPAFVEEPAGLRFTVRGYRSGPAVSEDNIGYEQAWEFIRAVTPSPLAVTGVEAESETPRQSAPLTDAFVERVAARGAAGRARFSHTGTARYRAAAEPSERGFGLKPPAYGVVAVDGEVVADDLVSLEEPALFPARFPFSLGGGAVPAVTLAAAPRAARIAPLGYFDAVQAMRAYVAAHPEERGRVRVIPYHREVSS